MLSATNNIYTCNRHVVSFCFYSMHFLGSQGSLLEEQTRRQGARKRIIIIRSMDTSPTCRQKVLWSSWKTLQTPCLYNRQPKQVHPAESWNEMMAKKGENMIRNDRRMTTIFVAKCFVQSLPLVNRSTGGWNIHRRDNTSANKGLVVNPKLRKQAPKYTAFIF